MKKNVLLLIFFSMVGLVFDVTPRIRTIPAHVVLKLYQMMKDIHEVFTQSDIPYWIHAGTLLGAVRHKGLIPWDDDIDLVIEKQDEEKFLAVQDIFKSIGYKIKPVQYGYKIICPQPKGHDIEVDIMTFIEKNGKYIYYDRTNIFKHIYFDKAALFPLKEYRLGQLTVMGPQDPIPYLHLAYPNWKTHAKMSNHYYFSGPTVPLTPEHLVPAEPMGPLVDNVKYFRNKFIKENLVIREAFQDDAVELSKLLDQLGYPQDSETMCVQKIEEFAQNKLDKIWVAYIDDKIVGLLALNIITPFYKPQPFARIDSLVVDEYFQKQGIGKRLIAIAEEYAQTIGCERIFLTSGNHRPEAHQFYQNLGYVSNATYFVKKLA